MGAWHMSCTGPAMTDTTDGVTAFNIEDGETVGRISRDMVLARLLDPRG